MNTAYVLLTALPPTVGHWQLILFARQLADHTVVIVGTQPEEPLAQERYQAICQAVEAHNLADQISVKQLHKTLPQDTHSPGFWELWQGIMLGFGASSGDYIVASESYGQKLAELTGAEYFPYDSHRVLSNVRATAIRQNLIAHFSEILPEFRPILRTRVTIFGAESTGKTTLSKALAKQLQATWLFEYARPYLEETVNEITPRSMRAIWRGQAALQQHADDFSDRAYIIQDTDLFSTVGYWQFPHWQTTLGPCPDELVAQALALQSDLYVITRSNIPFEQDPLRYGGTKREGSDEYWIDVCKTYNLPYIILEDSDFEQRLHAAKRAIQKIAKRKAQLIQFKRYDHEA